MGDKSYSRWFLLASVAALVLGLAGLAALIACGASSNPAPSEEASAPEQSSAAEGAPPPEPSAPEDAPRSDELSCPEFDKGSVVGTVDTPEITEASGLLASRRQPGILWAHNDSGDSARLFALTADGALVATYVLAGRARDWEDMALGPGPESGVDYLYIGDIGDNLSDRSSVTVHRLPEPAVPSVTDGNGTISVGDLVSFELRYPDGAHDAETLLSDPRTGDLYIVTKTFFGPGPTQLFRYSAEAQAAGSSSLEDMGDLDLGEGVIATAGDIAADGSQILLRDYLSAKLWIRSAGQSVAEAFAGRACDVPIVGFPEEPKGETIAFASDGRGYFTLSEGSRQPIYEFKRSD